MIIIASLANLCLLHSYISALSEDQEQPSLQTAISSGWPASLHLIGKVCWAFSLIFSRDVKMGGWITGKNGFGVKETIFSTGQNGPGWVR